MHFPQKEVQTPRKIDDVRGMKNTTHIPGGRHKGETPQAHKARCINLGWVPTSAGLETPMKDRDGRRVLYCFDYKTGEHAYIDTDTDTPVVPQW